MKEANIEETSLKLRTLTADDEDFLKEMVYIACWDAPDEPRRPRKLIEHPMVKAYYENWGQKGDYGVVAEVNGKPVGMANIRVKSSLTEKYKNYPEFGIALFEEYQGKGIGKILIENVIQHAKTRHKGIRLGVHPKNEVAIRLYKKYGFVEYETPPKQYPQFALTF